MNELISLSPYLLWTGMGVLLIAGGVALSIKSDYSDPHNQPDC